MRDSAEDHCFVIESWYVEKRCWHILTTSSLFRYSIAQTVINLYIGYVRMAQGY